MIYFLYLASVLAVRRDTQGNQWNVQTCRTVCNERVRQTDAIRNKSACGQKRHTNLKVNSYYKVLNQQIYLKTCHWTVPSITYDWSWFWLHECACPAKKFHVDVYTEYFLHCPRNFTAGLDDKLVVYWNNHSKPLETSYDFAFGVRCHSIIGVRCHSIIRLLVYEVMSLESIDLQFP